MSANPPAAFLMGERLYLRPLVESDADGDYPDWLNSAEVCRGNSHHVFPYTRESAREYIRLAGSARDALVLAVVLKKGDRHVGNVALQAIHPIHRSAELTILIGARDAWRSGYGFEAAGLLIDHGFRALNLQRIECATFAGNVGMQKLALRLGMKEEGRRRQAAFKDGIYDDVVEYGILRSDHAPISKTSQPATT